VWGSIPRDRVVDALEAVKRLSSSTFSEVPAKGAKPPKSSFTIEFKLANRGS